MEDPGQGAATPDVTFELLAVIAIGWEGRRQQCEFPVAVLISV